MPPLADALTLVIATILVTIAAVLLAFSLLSGVRQTRGLMLAGVFAALYATRMLTDLDALEPIGWLDRFRAALEYLVPLPAAFLFAHEFGGRLKRASRVIAYAFSALAVVAIPYELLIAHPYALRRLLDAVVVLFMIVFLINLFTATGAKLIRLGSFVFALFVLNEHLGVVPRGFENVMEPIGFLFFVTMVVLTLLQETIANRGRLIAVESELTTARTIQQSIIPDAPPRIEGLEIATAYHPASQVGGDFYDFVVTPDGELAVFIADVSGHGVPAALVASMLKIALAAQSELTDPAALLQQLNQLFCGRLKRQFFTATYAVIGSNAITLASGGHPPPIVCSPVNGSREVHADGFVIGRMRNARFDAVTAPFVAGDTAVFYTDGIIEARSPAEEPWGSERLQAFVDAYRADSAQQIAEGIIQEVRRWGAPDDDLTLVVVKRSAERTHFTNGSGDDRRPPGRSLIA
ncbi:MAG TPA: PP2C family protein-serine/threonine phosphatase [Thermoanaerobaculia bacterium]|jgi:sigma-B regulation protein RsbU (phosphoserine phosphatase)